MNVEVWVHRSLVRVTQVFVCVSVLLDGDQRGWCKDFAEDVGKVLLGGVWPFLDTWDVSGEPKGGSHAGVPQWALFVI